jgi:hydroxymethylpyrimidine/phosphomethylpyrimidine kinase
VVEDIGVDAVKIGMLGTAETVDAVDRALDLLAPGTPVVIDPVMVAESGAVLLDDAARAALVERLLPRATVITPNVAEAQVLAGDAAVDDVEALARGCRFRDCTHHGEPGCAVAAAIADGRLPADRVSGMRKLAREEAWIASRRDARARSEGKRHAKQMSRDIRRFYQQRGRR